MVRHLNRRAFCVSCVLPTMTLLLLPTHLSSHASAADKPKAPAVRVVVDPRVELVSILFRLAGNREYSQGRVQSYAKDVDKHFGPYRNHAAVNYARLMRTTRGVGYDACMSMAVHLTDAEKLGEKVPFDPRPEGLDARWTPAGARTFLEASRKFVGEAKFKDFLEAHKGLYATTESRMSALLEKDAHLEWFPEFFGDRPQASFTVALGLLNGSGNYGVHCRTSDGKEELYCILGVWLTDAKGLPQFNRLMLGTLVHEFCHSYTNAIVDKHEAEFRPAGEKLFPHVESAMRSQAYANWKTMIYESLVRASVVRYTRRHEGPLAAFVEVREQKQRKFLWIEELSDLLGEYETQRDRYPNLDAFAPRLVSFFNAYAEKFDKEQKAQVGKPAEAKSKTGKPRAGEGEKIEAKSSGEKAPH